MTDSTRIRSSQGLDLGAAQRRPVRQHQPPDRRRDARQGAAGRQASRSSSIRWRRPTARRSRSCSRNCSSKGHDDAEYDAWPIRIGEGDQFGSGFVDVNPNSKIPALVDRSGAEPVRVFESGAILVHLAEKFGEFLPASGPERAETLSWLFWQMGSAPFLGGGFGHFFAYAPEKFEYPINRYAMEAKRQLDVLNRHLAENEYIAGRRLFDRRHRDLALVRRHRARPQYPGADEFLATHEYEHLMRWARQIDARPAVKRGRIVNKLTGDPASSCTNATTPATSSCAPRTSCSPQTRPKRSRTTRSRARPASAV